MQKPTSPDAWDTLVFRNKETGADPCFIHYNGNKQELKMDKILVELGVIEMREDGKGWWQEKEEKKKEVRLGYSDFVKWVVVSVVGSWLGLRVIRWVRRRRVLGRLGLAGNISGEEGDGSRGGLFGWIWRRGKGKKRGVVLRHGAGGLDFGNLNGKNA
jgi:hypothetical protein